MKNELQTSDKTCREMGALKSFRNKVQDNEVWKIHQQAYRKYYARVMKRKMSQAEFNEWAKEAKSIRNETLIFYKQAPNLENELDLTHYIEELNCLQAL